MPVLFKKWERQSNYWGFNPEADVLVYSVHRDSDLIDVSNFHALEKKLMEFDDKEGREQYTESPVYSWRAKHFVVGWIDYLMLSSDAFERLKAYANHLLIEIQEYSILDEEDLANRELEADYFSV